MGDPISLRPGYGYRSNGGGRAWIAGRINSQADPQWYALGALWSIQGNWYLPDGRFIATRRVEGKPERMRRYALDLVASDSLVEEVGAWDLDRACGGE